MVPLTRGSLRGTARKALLRLCDLLREAIRTSPSQLEPARADKAPGRIAKELQNDLYRKQALRAGRVLNRQQLLELGESVKLAALDAPDTVATPRKRKAKAPATARVRKTRAK